MTGSNLRLLSITEVKIKRERCQGWTREAKLGSNGTKFGTTVLNGDGPLEDGKIAATRTLSFEMIRRLKHYRVATSTVDCRKWSHAIPAQITGTQTTPLCIVFRRGASHVHVCAVGRVKSDLRPVKMCNWQAVDLNLEQYYMERFLRERWSLRNIVSHVTTGITDDVL